MLSILGAGGQVGRALQRRAAAAGLPFRAFDRDKLDVTDRSALEAALGSSHGIVVNAAAYTAVDRAESEPERAMATNGEAPGVIAAIAAHHGLPLVHISTDYVFDGDSPRPYVEDDPVAPVSVYGRSKAAGEVAVRARQPRHILLRTAWVYDAEGQNFVRTMLRLASERPELRIVSDQKGGPTSADDIASAILRIAARIAEPGFGDWGTYHFCGGPPTSWYDFACEILAGQAVAIRPIASADYPTAARRPASGVLDCSKIARVFGIQQPDWRRSLKDVLARIERESKA